MNATLDIRNTGTPGTNYLVRGSANGTLYPMGAGPFGQDPSKYTSLIDPKQTSSLIDWGRTYIQNSRLNGATGNAGFSEIRRQSGEGKPWDTKQYLPNNSLYVINGKAELNDYVGNTIWATGVKSLGLSETSAKFGAQIQSLGANGALDDPRDQEALGFGFSLSLPSFRGAGASGGWGSGSVNGSWGTAGGGFLLYPNKANTNMMRSVYSK